MELDKETGSQHKRPCSVQCTGKTKDEIHKGRNKAIVISGSMTVYTENSKESSNKY